MNQISLHPCLKYHQLLHDICNPLKDIGVTFFGYTALDDANNAYCLGSKNDYAEAYLARNHVKKDILTSYQNDKKRYEYDFWDFQDLDAEQEEIYHMAAEFNQSHTLSITQHFDNKSHSFHFSGALNDIGLNQRLLEKMDYLHLFIDSFKHKLNTVNELKEIYNHPTQVDQSSIVENRVVNLIKENPRTLDIANIAYDTLSFLSDFYLTQNERECLKWLALGKSSELIAQILQVSRKTVERNVSAIKDKLGCYTLLQIGIKLAENDYMKFFSPIERKEHTAFLQ